MKIEVLYPEICNLFGELMNPEYLARCSGAELVYTSLKEEPKFVTEDIALVYMGYTTERGEEAVRDAFRPWLEALKKRTEAGGVTLFTGNILEVFGQYVEDDGGNRIPMLGLFPIHADRHLMKRYNSLYLGKCGDITIAGFKSQFGHSYGDVGEGLFTTTRGPGLNPQVKPEGIRINNLMVTYLIGPLTIINPPFTKYLLSLMGVENPTLLYEDAAMAAYKTRIEEFSDPRRGFTY